MLFGVNVATSFLRIVWDAWYFQRAGFGLYCIDVARNIGPESAVVQSRVQLAQPDVFAISISVFSYLPLDASTISSPSTEQMTDLGRFCHLFCRLVLNWTSYYLSFRVARPQKPLLTSRSLSRWVPTTIR
jgi:hypothetical protein